MSVDDDLARQRVVVPAVFPGYLEDIPSDEEPLVPRRRRRNERVFPIAEVREHKDDIRRLLANPSQLPKTRGKLTFRLPDDDGVHPGRIQGLYEKVNEIRRAIETVRAIATRHVNESSPWARLQAARELYREQEQIIRGHGDSVGMERPRMSYTNLEFAVDRGARANPESSYAREALHFFPQFVASALNEGARTICSVELRFIPEGETELEKRHRDLRSDADSSLRKRQRKRNEDREDERTQRLQGWINERIREPPPQPPTRARPVPKQSTQRHVTFVSAVVEPPRPRAMPVALRAPSISSDED